MCRDDPVSASAGFQEAPRRRKQCSTPGWAPGIGEAKERTDDRKCDDMFKMRMGFHLWPQQERRELIIYGLDETDVGEGRVCNEDDRCPR
jgi:hypothetical protein